MLEKNPLPALIDNNYFSLLFSSSAIPRNKMPFQDAIVFVVGGGNYIEYQNLNDYVKVAMFFIPWGLSHYCKKFIIMMV